MQQTGGFSPSQRDSGRHARQSQADRDLGIQPRRIGLPATGPGGRPRRDAADTLYQRACGTRLVTRPLFGGCSTLCGKPAAGCSTRPKSPSRRRHARRAPRRRQRHSRWVASPRVSSISSRTARPSARSRRRKSAEAPATRRSGANWSGGPNTDLPHVGIQHRVGLAAQVGPSRGSRRRYSLDGAGGRPRRRHGCLRKREACTWRVVPRIRGCPPTRSQRSKNGSR